jgi:putative salt-induced outer membrane protein YdiY
MIFGAMLLLARADVLIGINGERFVGTVIEETGSNVVFQSELGGRLNLSTDKIHEIQRTVATNALPAQKLPVTATGASGTEITANPSAWKPPGVGHDGADWVQLKSGEWLRGQLKYIQRKEVEFDSDEMEDQTLKLKDVRSVYTAERVFTQFEGREPVFGNAVISNETVTVSGPEPLSLPLGQLMGITPSGRRPGISYWSGNISAGFSKQSGNSSQTAVNCSAELARRTPNTTLLLDYLGVYSQVNGVQNVNNNRVNVNFDYRFNNDWFVRPLQFEYYTDPLANIANRFTGGVGAGYHIFDQTGLEWMVAAGPSYQITKFSNVETNSSDTATTPAGVLASNFKADITRRLTFIQTWQGTFTDREAGQYTHHSVSTLEFEIKRHLNLDVSYVWDYLHNPQPNSRGITPQKSDTYLTVGLGVRF